MHSGSRRPLGKSPETWHKSTGRQKGTLYRNMTYPLKPQPQQPQQQLSKKARAQPVQAWGAQIYRASQLCREPAARRRSIEKYSLDFDLPPPCCITRRVGHAVHTSDPRAIRAMDAEWFKLTTHPNDKGKGAWASGKQPKSAHTVTFSWSKALRPDRRALHRGGRRTAAR
jgi:hypothetical protein